MSTPGDFHVQDGHRKFGRPYSPSHPVPTVQKFRQGRCELDSNVKKRENAQVTNGDEEQGGTVDHVENAVKKIFDHGNVENIPGDPYPSKNRHATSNADEPSLLHDDDAHDESKPPQPPDQIDNKASQGGRKEEEEDHGHAQTASEATASHSDPREKRKAIKHVKRDDGGREVTDPVTHLPITIYDATGKDLKKVPENESSASSGHRTQTDLDNAPKSDPQFDQETLHAQASHIKMQRLFPPPNFDETQSELMKTYRFAIFVGIGSVIVCATLLLVTAQCLLLGDLDRQNNGVDYWQRIFIPVSITLGLSVIFDGLVVWALGGWLSRRVQDIWQDKVWDAARAREIREIEDPGQIPESTQWLNALFASVWPLINPDLFTSLADTLEDVMQASLPKLVRMVSVADLGQGNEAFRILGVRWLPTGSTSHPVDAKGNVKSSGGGDDINLLREGEAQHDVNDRSVQDGDVKNSDVKNSAQEPKDNTASGMEAEDADFVNLEIAFAYRARSSGKSIRTKSKNAHLYLKFYLPGSIALPVWVEMRGMIGTIRARLQLTPDPPFISFATITFLGQPKADLSCIPLNKHSLNIMDLPLISSFVQSSIDAALAEYVAPKSLNLDIKDMMVGDDYKKDTVAHGVIVVHIMKATDFKEGDGGLGPVKKGSSDAYVTIGWGKFGKPVASTRIISDQPIPVWDEYAHILVRTEELNAQELICIQLWDSDRLTADDDLGRVQIDLKTLMQSEETKGKMCDREDRFRGAEVDEEMPGTLSWSVGYFAKTHITTEQLEAQNEEAGVKSVEDLREKVGKTAERKLREAITKDAPRKVSQQKLHDFEEREDALIIMRSPSLEYPAGILSIQIHQIIGLELEQLNKNRPNKRVISDSDEEDEDSDDLPSSYCTIILNHHKIFKTRTKPKNTKPYFNAGCERFVRDWRSTEVIISVRDSRVHEKDPLLGIVYLPLSRLLKERSQVVESFPLAGGIGYGRIRISIIFRSIELQAPRELLGWDYGTLEISGVEASDGLPSGLETLKIRFRSSIGRGKSAPDHDNRGRWVPKHHKEGIFIPIKNRYRTPLVAEFYKSAMLSDSMPAFAVLWLKDIVDEEETTVTMHVWKGSEAAIKRAQSCVGYRGLNENEKSLGELKVKLRLWRGLSGYHKGISKRGKEADLKDVMEVLDTVDENETRERANGDDDGSDDGDTLATNGSDSSSSSSEDSALETGDRAASSIKGKVIDMLGGHNDPDDGRRGPSAQFEDYRDHHKILHRKHRGLMQWKGVRTVDWMMGKASRGKERVGDVFRHGDGEPGIETEV